MNLSHEQIVAEYEALVAKYVHDGELTQFVPTPVCRRMGRLYNALHSRENIRIDRITRKHRRGWSEKQAWYVELGNYDPEIHDEDSVFFRDTYTGPSELELGGGCTRCGCPDDCMCEPPPTRRELRDYTLRDRPWWDIALHITGLEKPLIIENQTTYDMMRQVKRVTYNQDVPMLELRKIVNGEHVAGYYLRGLTPS